MTKDRVARKLTTILAADVAGYSRLMGADEEATARTFKSYRQAIDKLIAKHAGRVFGGAGDSVIAEFASPVEAVRCAVEFQRDVEKRNAELEEARRMRFRIGVNLGDVMIDGDNLLGDGVNVAARLEGLAEPSGICVSGDVYRQVEGKTDLAFDDIGEQKVKNIVRPVRAYRVRLDGEEQAPARTAASQAPAFELPDKPSIAVLPFENMSGDPEQEYFADGIAEDIITALSRISWFFVTARFSSFTYKRKSADVRQVGRELGVRYVLEGSVRKSGQRVRITAQLIDAVTGNHLWADRFDRNLSDIFEVQDEITQNVVASSHTQVQLHEGSYFETPERPSLPVWALVNRAWAIWYDLTPIALAQGMRLAEEAVALDPNSGRAHQTLATMRWNTYWMGLAEDLPQLLKDAKTAATRALRLNGHDEYAHWIFGLISMGHGEFETAVAELERAIEINPNCSLAFGSLGTVLNFVGRPEESIANNETAIRSNPLDPSIFFRYSGLALSYFLLDECETAAGWAKKSVRDKPDWFQGHAILCASYAQLGRIDEARAAIQEYRSQFPSATISDFLRNPFQDPAHRERLANALQKAGLS